MLPCAVSLLAKAKGLEARGIDGVQACGTLLNSPKVGPKVYNTADSQVVTQPGTDAALQDLTSVIGREPVFFSKKAQRAFLFTNP